MITVTYPNDTLKLAVTIDKSTSIIVSDEAHSITIISDDKLSSTHAKTAHDQAVIATNQAVIATEKALEVSVGSEAIISAIDGKVDDGQVLTNVPLGAVFTDTETLTSISINANVLTYTDENGTPTNIDLSLYLDDSNLSRLTSGTLDGGTGIATFTRDDLSTFTVNMSALLDDTTVTVEDVLISISSVNALSANQGKVLKDLVDTKANASQVLTDVPLGAVFTDTTVTVEDVLTSTSTSNALSSAQGKALNESKSPKASPAFTGSITEQVGTITTVLTADNGTIVTRTMTADATFTDGLATGQSILLRLATGGFTPLGVLAIATNWIGGVLPTYTTTDDIVAYKIGAELRLSYIGSVVA